MPPVRTLFDKKVRETAGQQTNARYQFQAHVAMLKICDLHEGGEPYNVVLDHFDDVVLVKRSKDGFSLDFIQVKSRSSGAWTISALTAPKKDGQPPSSIVGKMYANAVVFGAATGSLSFLSNAGFSVKDVEGKPFPPEASKIAASTLSSDEQDAIEASLDADFPPPREPHCSGILFLERTPLGLAQQSTFVTGRLVELLSNLGEDDGLPVRALYETIFANVSAKSATANTYDDDDAFYAAKSISRGDIERVIAKAAATPRFRSWWPILAAELTAAGYTVANVLSLENSCFRYMRAKAAGQLHAEQLGEAVRDALSAGVPANLTGLEIVQHAEDLQPQLAGIEVDPLTVRAATIVEMIGMVHGDQA